MLRCGQFGGERARRPALPVAELQARFPAIDLFVRRARAVSAGFALSDTEAAIIGEICRRLDGLPLAIELMAARANLFTPAELLAQLDDRFTLLTSRARDMPRRHLSLRHAIGWSYGLLAPLEQQLLCRLSVFVGGCTLEAVQAVCCGDDGRSRFGMLESVHSYARERLAASGEAESMRARHGAYYLAMAEAAERAWDRAEEWLRPRLVAAHPRLHPLAARRGGARRAADRRESRPLPGERRRIGRSLVALRPRRSATRAG